MKYKLALILLTISYGLFGQDTLLIDLFEEKASIEYAKYYRVGKLDLNGNFIGVTKTIRLSDSTLYSTSDFFNGKRNGYHSKYYSSGKLKEAGNMSLGFQNGLWEEFYENGQLKVSVRYAQGRLYEIVSYFSESGDTLVWENNGVINEYHSNGKLSLEGRIKSGKSHGDWKYFNSQGHLESTEHYNNGKLVKGINYSGKNPIEYSYKYIPAAPSIGWTEFHLKLLKKARSKYPENEDPVKIGFIVNESGKLEDFQVVNGVNKEVDSIAISIVKSMSKWVPARGKGLPVSERVYVVVKNY